MRKLITLLFYFTALSSFSQTEELDNLTIQLAFQKPDTSKVNTSIQIIKLLYKNKDYNKALQFIKESEKLSNHLNYTAGIAEATYYKAGIYIKKDDYINAIDNYTKSKELYISLKDTLGIAKINNCIGLIEINRGNFDIGLQYIQSAIKILEQKGLKDELCDAYKNLATAYKHIESYDEAILFYNKTLDLEQSLSNHEGVVLANTNLADLYVKNKNYQKAIPYYKAILESLNPNDSLLKATFLIKTGSAYLQLNKLDQAKEYTSKGLRLSRSIDNLEGVLKGLNTAGEIYLIEKKPIVAERLLKEATTLGVSLKNEKELIKNYGLRAQLDSLKNNYKLAYNWLQKHYDLKNKVEKRVLSNLKKAINEPVIPIDLNGNNPEAEQVLIAQHAEENKKTQKQINRLKLIFYSLLVALVIVSSILALLYSKRKYRIKYTKKLEEKNRQIESQNESILSQSKNLKDINKVKDKLFSIVSHDLKDSLTSIKGFIDLLKDGSLSQEEFYQLIPELSENANNASLLLFNLLNWSKSQMQSLEAKPILFDIQEVFKEKINLIEQIAEKKGIHIVDNSLRDFVYADKSMVEIIIQNLLTNAVKFCEFGDSITIKNTISNGKALISIDDTGVGISKENQDLLFKNGSFTTIGTKNEKGTGLGLTISKELVALNHGRIWVESTKNIGSTFYVELPKTNPIGAV